MRKSNNSSFGKVLRYIGKYRYLLITSLILSASGVLLALYIPVLAGRAIDFIIGEGKVDFSRLTPVIIRIAVIALASAVIQWIANAINNRIAFNTVRDLRNDAVKKVNILPVAYLDSRSSGDIVSRIIADADQISDGLIMGFSQLFSGIVTVIITYVLMMRISPKITPVVVILTPMSILIARFIAKNTHNMFKLQSTERGTQTAFIDETVTNRKIISSYNGETDAIKTFDEINDRVAGYSLRAIFFSSITNPSTRFVNNTIYAAVAFMGALLAIGGSITVGGLTCFLSYAGQFAKPFNEISGVIAEFQNALACAERLFEIIEAEPETPDKADALELDRAEGNISISNVCFSYTKDRKLIEDLNLTAEKGTKIAIVGPTGCGKTTVINLLMRFYDVDSGSISVDLTDIRDIKLKSLRKNYGMVLQETWIKTGTVKENIAMGLPEASFEQIKEAAVSAHANSYIKKLPDGYDTVISEEYGLSQGQKQLICIARIMMLMPSILILDEATSSIDVRTELKIRAAFDRIVKGRTSFIVAHRLSTIKNSDIILVMNNGKIIEQGNHRDLMAKHGFYEKLYNSRNY
ncbi:MAG: ABC transporter ATP-binding protein [Clostridia bacterium]|nr:ABC transporter ATP-binding protein [Clostridia bacterium]